MRVVIEIDGTPVVATEMGGNVASGIDDKRISSEPPPELVRAAKALGAESAGAAKYILPAGAAEFRSAAIAAAQITPAGEREKIDAGRAAAIQKPVKRITARAGSRKRAK